MEEAIITINDIPGPVWEDILRWLDLRTLRSWRTLRLVSRFWRTTISSRVTKLSCQSIEDCKKLLHSDLRLFGASLRSLQLGSSSVPIGNISAHSHNHSYISSLANLKQLRLLHLNNCGSLFRSRDLALLTGHLPHLKSLSIKGMPELSWHDLASLLAQWPSLVELEFDNIEDFVSTVPITSQNQQSLVELECLHTLKYHSLGCSPSDLGLSYTTITNLTIDSCTSPYFADGMKWLSTLPVLQTLDLSHSNLDTINVELPPYPFPSLTSLTWNLPPCPIHVFFLLKLPKLARFIAVPGALTVLPLPDSVQSYRNLNILEWGFSHNCLTQWHWGVLQLMPNITGIYISDIGIKDLGMREVLNALEHVTSLALPQLSIERPDHILYRKSFASRIRSLDLSFCKMKNLYLDHWTSNSPSLTKLRLNGNSQLQSQDLSYLKPLSLRELDLSGCVSLGSEALKQINGILTLERLDLSYIDRLWTTHLRLLAPLSNLKWLGQVLLFRPTTHSSFDCLRGLWPRLEILRVESSVKLSGLASCFGPLVQLDLI